MYETTDAFTKFLPPEYAGLIQYVEVNGRTKIAVKGQITEYIPNPTFERVAAPGAQEEYFKHGTPRASRVREILGKRIQALPAFREPEPRLKLMDELGLDRALCGRHWPVCWRSGCGATRLPPTPWSTPSTSGCSSTGRFNYENRIFPTPVIHMGIVEEAMEELEWVLDRGAQDRAHPPGAGLRIPGAALVRAARVRPLLADGGEAGILVGMHASDSGYQRYLNEWEGITSEMTPFKAGSGFVSIIGHGGRAITDTVASLIGHGLCSRFPDIRFAAGRERQQLGPSTPARHGAGYTPRPRTASTRTRWRCSSAISTSTPSTRRTRWVSWSCSVPTGCFSAPTSPIPKAWPTRSASSTSSPAWTTATWPRSWGAT